MADATRVYRDRPTADEVTDVLAKRLVATVGTLNEDGSVHLAYVIFRHDGGRMFFETSSLTRKARNARRSGWASMLVQGSAGSGRQLMVAAEGTARIVAGDEARELNHRLRAKYIRATALEAVDRAWDRLDDIAVELTPRRWRSWTGTALQVVTQAELDVSYDDIWLPDG